MVETGDPGKLGIQYECKEMALDSLYRMAGENNLKIEDAEGKKREEKEHCV